MLVQYLMLVVYNYDFRASAVLLSLMCAAESDTYINLVCMSFSNDR